MTWNQLARKIAEMPEAVRRKPVHVEVIAGLDPLLYGVTLEDFETDTAVCAEIAEGDPVLKATN